MRDEQKKFYLFSSVKDCSVYRNYVYLRCIDTGESMALFLFKLVAVLAVEHGIAERVELCS